MTVPNPTPNRAGMICFNRVGEVLLISALGKPCVWVFPKGHIEKGESTYEAAEREVKEETGIYAVVDSVAHPVGITSYTYQGESVVCEWFAGFAVSAVEDEVWVDGREIRFVPWRTALDLLSFPSLRNMLRRSLCLPEVEDNQVTVTDPKEINEDEQ